MLNNTYKNHLINGRVYKPLLHKKGKQWIVVGLSALVLATFGLGLNVPAHAATNTVKANINRQLASAKVGKTAKANQKTDQTNNKDVKPNNNTPKPANNQAPKANNSTAPKANTNNGNKVQKPTNVTPKNNQSKTQPNNKVTNGESTILVNYVNKTNGDVVNSGLPMTKKVGTPFKLDNYLDNIPNGYVYAGMKGSVTQFDKDNHIIDILLNKDVAPSRRATNYESTILVEYVNRATGDVINSSLPMTEEVGTPFKLDNYLDNIPTGYAYDGMRNSVTQFDNDNHVVDILLDKDVAPSSASSNSTKSANSTKNNPSTKSGAVNKDVTSELNSLTSEVETDNDELASLNYSEANSASTEDATFDNLLSSGYNTISNLASSAATQLNDKNSSASTNTSKNASATKAPQAHINNLNDLNVGQTANLRGAKVTRLGVKKHFNWFMVTKNVLVHTNLASVGTNKHARFMLRPNHKLSIRINKIFEVTKKNGQKALRYEFKLGKHNYYVTGDFRYIKDSYLHLADFKKTGMHHIRLLRHTYEYESKHFNKKSFLRSLKPNKKLAVRTIFSFGKSGQTRLELTNGHFITANKNWVKLVK